METANRKQRDKKTLRALEAAQAEFHKDDPAWKRRENADFLIYLLVVLIAALSIRLFLFEPVRVDGISMETSLYTNERLFVEKVSYWVREPERYEVVICRYPDERANCVKRVIGLSGERVKVENGAIYINGAPLDESAYWEGYIFGDMPEITVPEKSVFVVGDNRNASKDSRTPLVGPVPYARVVGKAHFVMWPLSNWRPV